VVAELAVLLGPAAGERLLVDCDPAGSEWLLRPGIRAEPGLVTLAMAGRRELAPSAAAVHAQSVGEGLDVVVGPAAARQASSALEILGDRLGVHLAGLEGFDVVADCGRLVPASPALGVVRAADLVVLVSRPAVGEMVHLAPWVEQLLSEGRPVGVVLVDRGRRFREVAYEAAEVADALGVVVYGTVADDPAAAARLFVQPGSLAGLSRTRLVQSAAAVASPLWDVVSGPAPPAPVWAGRISPRREVARW
jgi:Mrp family chromosome partitioning ATPase